MSVGRTVGRSRRLGTILGAAACTLALVTGCGAGDGDAGGSTGPTQPPTATSAAPSTSTSAPTSEPGTSEPSSGDPISGELAGFSGELIVNRQRDLLDRGLINVLTHNRTGHTVLVTDRQLVSGTFRTVPAAPRRSMLQDGGDVAIQVPYGTTTDCNSTDPVEAAFHVTYTLDDDQTEHTAVVDLGGTEILDGIRAKQCAAIEFDDTTDTVFDDVQRTADRVDAGLRISRTADGPDLVVERATGTILVGVEPAPGATPFTVVGDTTVVDVTFVVNRCDPHALAEVTKRYGLDLHVVIDGRPAQPVPVDVSGLVDELDAAVEHCRTQQTD